MMNATQEVTFAPADRAFVYSVARKIVDEHDAEDVTQDALLLAYRYRDSFRGDARYRTWLYRIATTTALAHLRRQRRSRALAQAAASEFGCDVVAARPAPLPDAAVETAELCAVVKGLMLGLASPYRDVLIAREDSSDQEVARQLGISVANVKIRAHRARKYLRESIAQLDKSAA
jgi:RNA polymerase sigma-70 factor (ECF subfamily)